MFAEACAGELFLQEAGFVILRQSAAWKLLQHLKLQGPKSMLGLNLVNAVALPARENRFAHGEQGCVVSAAT